MQFAPIQTGGIGGMIAAFEAGQSNTQRRDELLRQRQTRDAIRDVFRGSRPAIGIQAYIEDAEARRRGLPYDLETGGAQTLMNAFRSPGPGLDTGEGGSRVPDPAPAAAAPEPGRRATDNSPLPINRDALLRLAQLNPELALNIQSASAQSRRQLLDEVANRMAVGSRVYSAVLAAPEDQRDGLYQQLRQEVEGAGIADLPDAWDENQARSRMRLGLSTAEALGLDMRQAAQDWSIKDDVLDNEALAAYREGQLSNTRRGQDLTDARGRRGQDMTDARIRGRAAGERWFGNGGRGAGRGGGSGGASTRRTVVDRSGNRIEVEARGNRWYNVATGQPLQ